MYSVLVTALMSVGTTTPQFWFHRGCHGCDGSSGCTGCTGCTGCMGCMGGGGGIFGLRSGFRDSGCYGCAGCYGSGYACSGCYGGCVGTYSTPAMYGGFAAAPCGCAAGGLPLGMPLAAEPVPPAGLGETVLPAPAGAGPPFGPPAGLGETASPPLAGLSETQTPSNQATVVATVPADAKLFADGALIPGTGPVRVFVTPPLDLGKDYFYELAIEVERGGKPVRNTVKATLQAGKTARVNIPEPTPDKPTPPMGTGTARIRVNLPEGAALYVEGRPWVFPAGRREIATPPLPTGRTHYYLLRVEIERDGRREVLTREVAFRAGEQVTVDFTRPSPAQIVRR